MLRTAAVPSRGDGKLFRVWLTHLAPLDGLALWRGNCSVGRCVIVVGAGLCACPWLLVSSKAIRRAGSIRFWWKPICESRFPHIAKTTSAANEQL